jgi:hypothetical protein
VIGQASPPDPHRLPSLKRRAAALFSGTPSPSLADVDDLLADCAARALSLRAELLRTHRELFAAYHAADDPTTSGDPGLARSLVLKSEMLHAESAELSRLTTEVREQREAVDARVRR